MKDEARKADEKKENAGKPIPEGLPDKVESAADAHSQEQLDEALEETFPSSDPIAVKITR